jgi:hypothetical protein
MMFGNLFGWIITEVGVDDEGRLWMDVEKADFVTGTKQMYRGYFSTFSAWGPEPILPEKPQEEQR